MSLDGLYTAHRRPFSFWGKHPNATPEQRQQITNAALAIIEETGYQPQNGTRLCSLFIDVGTAISGRPSLRIRQVRFVYRKIGTPHPFEKRIINSLTEIFDVWKMDKKYGWKFRGTQHLLGIIPSGTTHQKGNLSSDIQQSLSELTQTYPIGCYHARPRVNASFLYDVTPQPRYD